MESRVSWEEAQQFYVYTEDWYRGGDDVSSTRRDELESQPLVGILTCNWKCDS